VPEFRTGTGCDGAEVRVQAILGDAMKLTRRGLFGMLGAALVAPKLLPAPKPAAASLQLGMEELEAKYLRPAMIALANEIDAQAFRFVRSYDGHHQFYSRIDCVSPWPKSAPIEYSVRIQG
jgi:hypothetical protein